MIAGCTVYDIVNWTYTCGFFYSILQSQRVIAMVAEMIHTASLVHDDVIDAAETRRGQASVQAAWGQRQVCSISPMSTTPDNN